MGIARSTFYAKPAPQDDTAIVEVISGICEEFEFYGWRRVRAELRHRGLIVNHKKVRRLMREHDLQPRRRRRCVATTDSDHDQPIYPNRAKDLAIDGPDQLWVADITYVAIREGFAYVAVILDAWSRRAIGYAISRSIDVRLTLAALNTAVERRKPPPGCIHHSDRGSQGGVGALCALVAVVLQRLIGLFTNIFYYHSFHIPTNWCRRAATIWGCGDDLRPGRRRADHRPDGALRLRTHPRPRHSRGAWRRS